MVDVPGHFSWPSGHATQAFMVAELLTALLLRADTQSGESWFEMQQQLWRQAERIATNRVVAGLHFPIDNDAGCLLGIHAAHVIIDAATGRPAPRTTVLASHAFGDPTGRQDFSFLPYLKACSRFRNLHHFDGEETHVPQVAASPPAASERPVQWLWRQASAEWHGAGRL